MTRYTVQVLHAGQREPYGDSEYEYTIRVERTITHGKCIEPGFPTSEPGELRAWAKKLIRALCQDFRETGDNDGREGMEAYFYPTLKMLDLNRSTGVIHVLIIERYCD